MGTIEVFDRVIAINTRGGGTFRTPPPDDASMITGVSLPIDGGYTIR
jgi:hypothetical protein